MRTATSRRRLRPRASSSPATLMQAMSSTPATAASSTSSAVRTPWTITSCARVTSIVALVLVSGYAFSRRAAMPATSRPRLVDRHAVLQPGDRLDAGMPAAIRRLRGDERADRQVDVGPLEQPERAGSTPTME